MKHFLLFFATLSLCAVHLSTYTMEGEHEEAEHTAEIEEKTQTAQREQEEQEAIKAGAVGPHTSNAPTASTAQAPIDQSIQSKPSAPAAPADSGFSFGKSLLANFHSTIGNALSFVGAHESAASWHSSAADLYTDAGDHENATTARTNGENSSTAAQETQNQADIAQAKSLVDRAQSGTVAQKTESIQKACATLQKLADRYEASGNTEMYEKTLEQAVTTLFTNNAIDGGTLYKTALEVVKPLADHYQQTGQYEKFIDLMAKTPTFGSVPELKVQLRAEAARGIKDAMGSANSAARLAGNPEPYTQQEIDAVGRQSRLDVMRKYDNRMSSSGNTIKLANTIF